MFFCDKQSGRGNNPIKEEKDYKPVGREKKNPAHIRYIIQLLAWLLWSIRVIMGCLISFLGSSGNAWSPRTPSLPPFWWNQVQTQIDGDTHTSCVSHLDNLNMANKKKKTGHGNIFLTTEKKGFDCHEGVFHTDQCRGKTLFQVFHVKWPVHWPVKMEHYNCTEEADFFVYLFPYLFIYFYKSSIRKW